MTAPPALPPPALDLPVTARTQWARLGEEGAIAGVYRDGGPHAGVDPARLRGVLGGLHAEYSPGLVLSACVQLATALPLLAEAGRSGRGPCGLAADRMLAGLSVVALAATDAGSGSDLTALGTRVEPDGDRLTVTGTKRWITNAAAADQLLVLARRRPGPHFTNFSWVLVPADAAGVRIEPADDALFEGAAVGHVHLDAVSLPADAVVGGAGRGLALFARHIAVERLAGGLWATAWCHRALTETKEWLVRRQLWELDVVRQQFAAALVKARELGALVDSLAEPIAQRRDHGAAALVKAATGQTIGEVLDTCAHLVGAEGFITGGLQQQRAQVALFGIAGGSTEVVLAGVADQADRLLAALDPGADS